MAATKARAAFYWMPRMKIALAHWYEREKKRARAQSGPHSQEFYCNHFRFICWAVRFAPVLAEWLLLARLFIFSRYKVIAEACVCVCRRVSMSECEAEAFEAFKIKFGSNALFIILQRVSCIRRAFN